MVLTASNSENIMNCQKELVEYMYFDFNVEKTGNGYSLPICFIQGESDWITPTDMVKVTMILSLQALKNLL